MSKFVKILKQVPKLSNPELLCFKGYVNNQWIDNAKDHFTVTNPATGKLIGKLPEFTKQDVNDAIDVASKVFKEYKNTSPRERSLWLRNIYNLMIENIEDLAKIITWENGKSIKEARGEIKYAASYFEWYSEEASRLYGTTIQTPNMANRVYTRREPVGVCGLICPWNFPSAMITRKAAAALSVGCTVVVKPDSQTPFSALALAYLSEKAGFPKGAFNVILSHNKTKDVGLTLCESSKIKKISFTGSTNVGKILMKQSSSTLKKLSMELGGNAPLIVFKDADLELAVKETVASKFRSLGQTCVCVNRIYVHSSIIDKFTEMVVKEVQKFVIGDGFSEETTHGCLINQQAIEKVEKHVADAVGKGAKVSLKGGPIPELGSNFYAPYVLTNVPHNAIVGKEETFGPLCPIFSFDSIDEVIGYANDTQYGLASYVFSRNVNTLYKVSEELEAGMVSCNTGLFSDSAIPFGGIKESGYGREGSLHGIEDYTVIKTITMGNIN
ncbi:hypothetical protein TBLA_0F00580 [Henningerozyma blattae CBS 6284]|uniref:Succinate-semialdehyde dehydrogenase n=1 Tax=Henningerozyma blattae (strain ATCC 34711 / CBS 6284 / DSM 70876 / NBRC 10599 / NRRL Y-10934 / UCD 77-7) TaxID=1071380 RepID=I2H5F0_HENB6|nr:hypothetical protein TBLA_0F00580 [Tetrapisispora blattae CBS 6284]CCH61602.1 hypothetical protein TBLA_0F00580 [Tetrapisispora blattae CBS 6284]